MNESLKTLENLTEFLCSELKRNVDASDLRVTVETFHILKGAVIDCINLKRKIEDARMCNH